MTDFDEQRIQNQFGGFCTKVLKREARCIQREYAKTRELEKSFGELSELEFYGLSAYDEYFKADHVFDVLGTPVVVNSDFLAQAISKLSEDKRDIILLSYFLDMSDGEISRKMNVLRRTICKRRLKSLSELQDYLLKEGYDWSDV